MQIGYLMLAALQYALCVCVCVVCMHHLIHGKIQILYIEIDALKMFIIVDE